VRFLQGPPFHMKKLIIVGIVFWALGLFAASIELEWTVPNDKNIKEYSISWWSDSGVAVTKVIEKSNRIRIDSLVDGKPYCFQITPIGFDGQYGQKSNIVYYKPVTQKVDALVVKPELKIKKINEK
jgi:hypothetical protein